MLFFIDSGFSQLLGHFGSKRLPTGTLYRDLETRTAAKAAIEIYDQTLLHRNFDSRHSNRFKSYTPRFSTKVNGLKIGKKMSSTEIFDSFDSLFITPIDNKPRKLLSKIIEKETNLDNNKHKITTGDIYSNKNFFQTSNVWSPRRFTVDF